MLAPSNKADQSNKPRPNTPGLFVFATIYPIP